MEFIVCCLIGYFIGTINPAYIISRLNGFDIREKGSQNAGASNVVIVMGKARGALCALLDIGKACFAIHLGRKLFPLYAYVLPVAGASCIMGHIFPVQMKFRGGKGLACLGGMILMYDVKVFLMMLLLEVAVLLITDYICFVPITASVLFAGIYGALENSIMGALILLLAALVIISKHRKNIERIRKGTELHLSYLWNKQAEIERIQGNMEEN